MKFKVDCYEIYNKGRTYKVLKFPRVENAWAFDDFPEDDQLMLDGDPEFYRLLHHAIAALITDPSVIIYFPIKHPGDTSYHAHMTFDAVLLRPELQFRRSRWYSIKSKLNKQHWRGKYTIHHDIQKLDDYWKQLCKKRPRMVDHWERRIDREFYKDIIYDLLVDTVFMVLPRDVCYMYHRQITLGLADYRPDKEYGEYTVIGYIMPPK